MNAVEIAKVVAARNIESKFVESLVVTETIAKANPNMSTENQCKMWDEVIKILDDNQTSEKLFGISLI